MRRRDFWDSSLEKRYNEYKKDKTRPTLKVVLITKCFSPFVVVVVVVTIHHSFCSFLLALFFLLRVLHLT